MCFKHVAIYSYKFINQFWIQNAITNGGEQATLKVEIFVRTNFCVFLRRGPKMRENYSQYHP